MPHNSNERKTLKIAMEVFKDKIIHTQESINQSNSKIPESLPINLPETNKKYYKTIVANDVPLQAYVDFGSDCSLIRSSDARNLRLTEITDNLPVLRGFGNSVISPMLKVKILAKIDEVEAQLELLVVDDKFLYTAILLGQNFTDMPSITVLKDKDNLFFYSSPEVKDDFFSKEQNVLKLFVVKETKLEKGGLLEVYSNDSYTGDVYSDGNTRMNPNQEYHFHRGCYRLVNGRGYVFVTILNNSSVTFPPDLLLARVTPASESGTLQPVQVNMIQRDFPVSCLDKTDIKVNSDLNAADLERLYCLLQKYRCCFATNLRELG